MRTNWDNNHIKWIHHTKTNFPKCNCKTLHIQLEQLNGPNLWNKAHTASNARNKSLKLNYITWWYKAAVFKSWLNVPSFQAWSSWQPCRDKRRLFGSLSKHKAHRDRMYLLFCLLRDKTGTLIQKCPVNVHLCSSACQHCGGVRMKAQLRSGCMN